MKTMMKLTTALVIAGALGACSTPAPEELASADYGAYPANYLDVIRAYHEANLKDPSSAQVKVLTEPRKGYITQNYRTVYGYRACLVVNAKNSFGGYTGAHITEVFMRDDRVLRYRVADGRDPTEDNSIRHACAQ